VNASMSQRFRWWNALAAAAFFLHELDAFAQNC
jgi:hypothetical protein